MIDTAKKAGRVSGATRVFTPQECDLSETAHRTSPAAQDQERRNRHCFRHGGHRKLGLLKMDFLGLTTLTILDDALKLIVQATGTDLKLEDLPLQDEKTYEKVFHSGFNFWRVSV